MSSEFLQDLLDRNEAWASEQLAEDVEFFHRHEQGQKPRLLFIGCSDSRVPAEQIMKCGPGELFIHRNVANVVAYNDINIASVIEYAITALKVQDVVVCGHYSCGGVAAACADKLHGGYIGDWLMITSWAKKWVDERLGPAAKEMPREEYLKLVVEENVRLQVKHMTHLSVVREAWDNHPNIPRLHGWVYDIASGRIKVLLDGVTSASQV